MNGKEIESEAPASEIKSSPAISRTETPAIQTENEKLLKNTTPIEPVDKKKQKKKKEPRAPGKSPLNFLYNPKKRTVLGRDGLNWAKLAGFYTCFYLFLGCFFCLLLLIFALMLDRHVPTYYNTESTMAVRSTASVVGMGFRPQPVIDDNLIRVTDDPQQQARIASSLRLFRDVFLLQRSDARTENCSDKDPATELPQGTACAFNWFHIVPTQDHPCSDNNMYGFKNEQPCVLVKLNKVYDWQPSRGPIPVHIQKLRGVASNKSVSDPDVHITCSGTHTADVDALKSVTYYSVERPSGSTKYGSIPNYFFPYRNARDHVQPFVLVQFKNLPTNRLISVTCRAWAPGIEHDSRGMRGMVNFQLYRTHTIRPTEAKEEVEDDVPE